MRALGVILVLVGLVATALGTFSGFGALFGWNGRHPVVTHALEPEVAVEGRSRRSYTLVPVPGRRYTVSVQVVFDRDSVSQREGALLVDAKMPLVLQVKDSAGTSLAGATGWVDPNEPPNVLYGQAPTDPRRGPRQELVVERLVGPFIASSKSPVSVDVELGADRVGSAQIVARRVVIYDDALPPSIRNSFIVAGLGVAAFFGGAVLLAVGWWKRRRGPRPRGAPRKRGGIPQHDVV